jgi:hypothetical protein
MREDRGGERDGDRGGYRERRPVLERIGLFAVAVVMAALFAGVAAAAFVSGEYILAAMGFVGCVMTAFVGGSTLIRG